VPALSTVTTPTVKSGWPYRPDGRVIYTNGGGGATLGGTGDWMQIISNACEGFAHQARDSLRTSYLDDARIALRSRH